MVKKRSSKGGTALTGVFPGILLLIVAVVAGGALLFFHFSAPKRPKLDKISLCPVSGPLGISVVLVDTSDDLSDTTKREVSVILDDLVKALPEYHMLDIRVLDIAASRSRSLFAKCNPGDGAGLSEWTENPRIARQRWIESFRQPANIAIENSLAPAKATSSPLMAAIQDIAIDKFSSSNAQQTQKTLIVISDMIEYTRDYSQYPRAGDLSYERYKSSPAYLRFRTDLHGAVVQIDYVRRDASIDTVKHVSFWKDWITDNRGSFGGARSLQGK